MEEKMIDSILNEINLAKEGGYSYKELKEYVPNHNKKHELLFFIKPEVTLRERDVNIKEVLQLISDKFNEYDVSVDSVSVLGAGYLNKYDIIAQHYGVINELATKGKDALSEPAKQKFKEIYGKDIDDVEVLGGFEFIKKYPYFNSKSLGVIWETKGNNKLASGTYVSEFKVDEGYVYVICGFHPNQISHYTNDGRSIVAMAISSDYDWKVLRDNMVGFTKAFEAYKGSIRRELYDNIDKFNLAEVSQAYNGVHLSAGPVESLAELIRFVSKYDSGVMIRPSETAIGKHFIEKAIPENRLKKFIINPKVNYHNETISVFDLTEEINLIDAINKLKEAVIEM